MYNVSNSYNQKAFGDSRRNYVKAVFSSATLLGDDIISIEFTENVHDGTNIGLGLTPSQSVKMTFRQPLTALSLLGAWFTLYHSFDNTNWCPLGKFKVSEYETKTADKTVEIKAYDQMAYMAEAYTPSISYPATLQNIITDIATQYSFQVEETVYPSGTYGLPEGATARDMIGYVAGMLGRNALFNRDGKLEFRWYKLKQEIYGDVDYDDSVTSADVTIIENELMGSTPIESEGSILGTMIVGSAILGRLYDARSILADVNEDGIVDQDDVDEIEAYLNGTPYPDTKVGTVCQYAQPIDKQNYQRNGITKYSQQTYTFSYLLSGTSDVPITSGSGDRGITFYNPWMTQSRLDTIKADVIGSGFTFLACKVEYRGNPSWEVGDIIRVTDENGVAYNVPINNHVINIEGGMKANFECKNDSDQQTVISQAAPDLKTLTQEVKDLEKMSQTISGATGGYYRLLQDAADNNRPYGFQIGNDQNFTKKWMFTYGGLGFYNGNTLLHNSVAFDMNGNLNADYITAGSISANRISAGTITGAVEATNFKMSGGTINLATASETDDKIKLSHADKSVILQPSQIKITKNGAYTYISPNQITLCDDTRAVQIFGNGGRVTTYDDLQVGMNSDDPANIYCTGTIYEGGVPLSSRYYRSGASPNFVTVQATACNPTSSGSGNVGTSGNYWNIMHANNFCVHTGTTTSNAYCGFSSAGYLQKYSSSSRQYKENILPLTDAQKDKIRGLYDIEVKRWNYKEGYLGEEDELYGKETIGVIAEDVDEIMSDLAVHRDGKVEDYRDRQLLNALLFLIQEQHREIEELKARIEE